MSLPAKEDFLGNGIKEGQFRIALGNLIDAIRNILPVDGSKIPASEITAPASGNLPAGTVASQLTKLDTIKVNTSDITATPAEQKTPKTAAGTTKLDKGWIPGLLVAETIVSGSAVTSVSFTGLTTVAHGGYELIATINNTTGSSSNYSVFFNNDTTLTNYNTQYLVGSGSTVSSGLLNSATATTVAAGASMSITANINPSASGKTRLYGDFVTTNVLSNIYVEKIATITDLTRLDITATVSNAIGIGSTFRLYRRL